MDVLPNVLVGMDISDAHNMITPAIMKSLL